MLLTVMPRNMSVSPACLYTAIGSPLRMFSMVWFTYASPRITRTNVSSYAADKAPKAVNSANSTAVKASVRWCRATTSGSSTAQNRVMRPEPWRRLA